MPIKRQTISTAIHKNTDYKFIKRMIKGSEKEKLKQQNKDNNADRDDSIEFGSDGEDPMAEEIQIPEKK